MTILYFVNQSLALGTIVAQIFILSVVVCYLFFRKKYIFISKFLGKKGMLFAFVVALVATLGSLFYSQFVNFAPCDLCWLQRIFMYPEVILLGLALIKKDSNITDYVLSLSFIGFLISLYHNYITYVSASSVCKILGGVSCTKLYVLEFGYITIPLMTLTAFTLIIVFLLFYKLQDYNDI